MLACIIEATFGLYNDGQSNLRALGNGIFGEPPLQHALNWFKMALSPPMVKGLGIFDFFATFATSRSEESSQSAGAGIPHPAAAAPQLWGGCVLSLGDQATLP